MIRIVCLLNFTNLVTLITAKKLARKFAVRLNKIIFHWQRTVGDALQRFHWIYDYVHHLWHSSLIAKYATVKIFVRNMKAIWIIGCSRIHHTISLHRNEDKKTKYCVEKLPKGEPVFILFRPLKVIFNQILERNWIIKIVYVIIFEWNFSSNQKKNRIQEWLLCSIGMITTSTNHGRREMSKIAAKKEPQCKWWVQSFTYSLEQKRLKIF